MGPASETTSNNYMKISVARSYTVTFDFAMRDQATGAPVTLDAFNLVARVHLRYQVSKQKDMAFLETCVRGQDVLMDRISHRR